MLRFEIVFPPVFLFFFRVVFQAIVLAPLPPEIPIKTMALAAVIVLAA